ncbi:MAG TPA: sigma-70 family RNA polymerase sigma factor [Polyangiaceae bacterium]|nr:sigma-70 family RNA polymerase sigma factor [Polyangiaceae bacterium]
MSSIMPQRNSNFEELLALASEIPPSHYPAVSRSPSYLPSPSNRPSITHFSLRPPRVPRDSYLPVSLTPLLSDPVSAGPLVRSVCPPALGPVALGRDKAAPSLSRRDVDYLLQRHTPMVKKIVGGILRRVPGHILVDDLVAAGLSGLWDAIRRCGDLPEEHFQRYAGVRIRGAVYDELRAQDWLPRRMRAAVTQRSQGEDRPKVGVVFFDDLGEGDQSHMGDAEPALNGEEFLAAKAFGERLVEALERLPARERRIILGHHLQGLKLRDLGAELKVTDARVSQLHGRAMRRLKAMMAEAEAEAEAETQSC